MKTKVNGIEYECPDCKEQKTVRITHMHYFKSLEAIHKLYETLKWEGMLGFTRHDLKQIVDFVNVDHPEILASDWYQKMIKDLNEDQN